MLLGRGLRDGEDDEVRSVLHALLIEVHDGGHEARAGFRSLRDEELRVLTVHRGGREAKRFEKHREVFVRDRTARVVVFRRIARAKELEDVFTVHDDASPQENRLNSF